MYTVHWLILGCVCVQVASPIEVIQFIYVSLALDDAALLGGEAQLGPTIITLVCLYLVEAVAVGVQVGCVPTVLVQAVMHDSVQLVLLKNVGSRVVSRLRRSLLSSALRQEVAFLDEQVSLEVTFCAIDVVTVSCASRPILMRL